ncbi:hypothetical protein Pcinc_041663 [Petrolisthes cinctipes]|uniref:Uncharacterized protein n=1 Tax=Petrolisthes cinctipes TaxID=88211 RepID=A0AAE1BMS9_PETCI|nr:hypothetical protein Pcinc_041663 [Petrolisthes cinctipes]
MLPTNHSAMTYHGRSGGSSSSSSRSRSSRRGSNRRRRGDTRRGERRRQGSSRRGVTRGGERRGKDRKGGARVLKNILHWQQQQRRKVVSFQPHPRLSEEPIPQLQHLA